MKKSGFLLLGLAVFFVAAGYLLPSEITIQREIKIHASVAAVYWKISDLKQWENWSGLVPTEPESHLQYLTGEFDTDTGFCWQTAGFESQKRRLLLTSTSFCDSVSTSMSFDKDDIARNCFRFQKSEGETLVSWEFQTKLGDDILSRWKGLFVHQLVGPDMKSGLSKLKSLCEDGSNSNPRQVTELN